MQNEQKPITEFINWLSQQDDPSSAFKTALQAVWQAALASPQKASPGAEAAPKVTDLGVRLSFPVYAWLQKAAFRSSLVSRMIREAEDRGWTQHEFLFHLTEALYSENETLKERLAQNFGRYGLPSDLVVRA